MMQSFHIGSCSKQKSRERSEKPKLPNSTGVNRLAMAKKDSHVKKLAIFWSLKIFPQYIQSERKWVKLIKEFCGLVTTQQQLQVIPAVWTDFHR